MDVTSGKMWNADLAFACVLRDYVTYLIFSGNVYTSGLASGQGDPKGDPRGIDKSSELASLGAGKNSYEGTWEWPYQKCVS